MKYDWKEIIESQQSSGLTIKQYCEERDIPVSSFYKYKRNIKSVALNTDSFIPVVVTPSSAPICLTINGYSIECEASSLPYVLGALK